MDHYDLPGQRRDIKHKGRNVVWSIAMDKCLIEALSIQAKNGNKIDKCFNENAYTAACIAVNSRFNLNLNNQKVVNRLKTIKKRYRIMKDMLCQDGFRWNPNTKMIECEHDELWKRYIAAHPDARQFRGKQIEMYDELKIVCGNYQAPSRWAKLKDGSFQTEMKNCEDDSASFASPSSEDQSETDGTESYTGTEPPEYGQMPDGSQEPPLIHPLRQLPKRPRSSEALQDAMLAVASSIRRLADAMERSKCSFDPSELLQAVMEIDGLEESKQMYAFEYLNADPIKARAFLTYNAQMRKTYLFRQFWWWK
ncbi:L10-interacting MYB domain-containing protein [Morus notabilis]|nr:L10-interacting MYB domain-containing protein [Morus notabilis]XP_024018083.1 L10-interacting MYB domain-containing protein [Morus notabilis]XP_024018084.1 L10-interacting MYB domain-containing protein [Morus notabilis]XP_024018085.1 L10-interacting MYB domain-containing protein [Morus notabilis]